MAELHGKLNTNLGRIRQLLLDLATEEGLQPTVLDGVNLYRTNLGIPRGPVLYEPSIYVVASGRKRGYLGERQFVFDPNHYLVLSVAAPFEVETEIGPNGEPMLGVSVRIDMPILSELAYKLNMQTDAPHDSQSAVITPTPLDVEMSEAVLRLLHSLQSDTDAVILGPGVVRELIYRVLKGPHGGALRSILNRTHHTGKIYVALEWIHQNYSRPLTISNMAKEACMSISGFHHNFKEVTGKSPLQYVKSVRLHKARLHIKYDRLTASGAAARVGYESPSQFSRDFKRFFGHSPTCERIFVSKPVQRFRQHPLVNRREQQNGLNFALLPATV